MKSKKNKKEIQKVLVVFFVLIMYQIIHFVKNGIWNTEVVPFQMVMLVTAVIISISKWERLTKK